MMKSSLTYDEIEPKLDIIEPKDSETALMNLADFNQILEQARASI